MYVDNRILKGSKRKISHTRRYKTYLGKCMKKISILTFAESPNRYLTLNKCGYEHHS